jgi:hypothetical protein
MKVHISWAYRDLAEAAAGELGKAAKAEMLPELFEYREMTDKKPVKNLDVINANILALRLVIPELQEAATFRLSKRLPGSKQLLPAVAARNYLLSKLPDKRPANSIELYGLPGLRDFLPYWACACAALAQPLPFDFWRDSPQIEILPNSELLRALLQACSETTTGPAAEQYKQLSQQWLKPGLSAELDGTVLVTASWRFFA